MSSPITPLGTASNAASNAAHSQHPSVNLPTWPHPSFPTAYPAEPKGMPCVGRPAPFFSAKAIVDGRIKEISLNMYTKAGNWLILVFIPMAWSFVCPTEVIAFDRRIQEFETRLCSVIFCSTDSEYVLRSWNHTSEEEGGLGEVHVPLMSDRSHKIARDYGVLIESEGVAQRAMFIIDPRGVIRQVTTNDANVGRSVDEARRLLDALEFTDEYGEGCPIDWKKGDAGVRMAHPSAPESNGEQTKPKKSPPPARPSAKRQTTWHGWLGSNRSSSTDRGSRTPTAEMPMGGAPGQTYSLPLHSQPQKSQPNTPSTEAPPGVSSNSSYMQNLANGRPTSHFQQHLPRIHDEAESSESADGYFGVAMEPHTPAGPNPFGQYQPAFGIVNGL